MTVGACKRQKIKASISNDEQMKCVTPSSRRLATCASTASASTSTDSHRRPPWTKPQYCRTAPQTWSCTSRTTATAGACGRRSQVCELGLKPSKENASHWQRPHLRFQQKIVHNDLQRAPASTPAHPKAAVELLRKSSRPQCRVPKQRAVAKPCQQLRCAAAGRPPRSKESHCSCEPNTRWAGRRAPEAAAHLPH